MTSRLVSGLRVVRIDEVGGETRLEPLGSGRTRVVYTFLGELGGDFPRKAEEKAHRPSPSPTSAALRRALDLPHPEK